LQYLIFWRLQGVHLWPSNCIQIVVFYQVATELVADCFIARLKNHRTHALLP